MSKRKTKKSSLKKDFLLFKTDFSQHFIYTLFIIGLTIIIVSVVTFSLRKQIEKIINPPTSPKVIAQLKKEAYQEQATVNNNIPADGKDTSGVIFHGSRDKKQVAITFDAEMTDGMKAAYLSHQTRSSYDPRIIDTLIKTDTKATLFLTGMWIELYPGITHDLAANKLFELGSHSYTDSSYEGNCWGLKILPQIQLIEEIGSTEKLLREHAGIDNKLFRFPGGCYSRDDVKLVNDSGDTVVHWDVVGNDGFNYNTEQIVHNVVDHVQNGSIIVLHMNGEPTAPKTAEALLEIIKQLKAKGFEFVKVSKLLNL